VRNYVTVVGLVVVGWMGESSSTVELNGFSSVNLHTKQYLAFSLLTQSVGFVGTLFHDGIVICPQLGALVSKITRHVLTSSFRFL
jgi:hypothetical protein